MDRYIDLGKGYSAEIGAWSGNRRPWAARVFHHGKYIGTTGFCASEGRATDAAKTLADKHRAHFFVA